MNLARFGLFIDPAPAQAGAKATIAAVKSIKPALDDVAKAADQSGKATKTMGESASTAGGKAAQGMKKAADETRKAGDAAKGASSSFDGLVGKILKMVSGLALAYGAFKLLGMGIGFVMESIGKADQMEGFRTRWAYMLGSFDLARQKMKELAQFANSTPFDLPGVTQASLALAKLKKTGLETMAGLRLVGDAAALAQQPIEEVAQRIARLTNNLKRGGGGGDEVRILGEWQIFSPELVGRIADMGTKASNFKKLLGEIKAELGNASGAMGLMSTTWDGLTSTMADAWGAFKTAVGEPIMEGLKPLVSDLTRIIDRMTSSVTAMGPEIQRVVTMIPAAFRVLQTDGGLRLALTAAWEVFSDLMERTWKATGIVVPALMKRAAYEFVTQIDKLNQSGFFDGMIKNLKEGLTGTLKDVALSAANPGKALGETYMEWRTGPNAEKLAKQDKAYKAAQNDGSGRTPMKMDDGSISFTDPDLPTKESRATANYDPNALLGAPPPVPDFSDSMGPAVTGPAAKQFGSLLNGMVDQITKEISASQKENEALLRQQEFTRRAKELGTTAEELRMKEIGDIAALGKYKSTPPKQPDASLFPEYDRNDDIVKKAQLPGSDMPYEDAEAEAKKLKEKSLTLSEAHDKEVADIEALKQAKLLSETDVTKAVIKSKEAYVLAQQAKKDADKAHLDHARTGTEKLLFAWGDMKTQIDGMNVAILQSMESNISGGLVAMIEGTKSAGQAFADMAKGIVSSILQIVTKLLVQYALMSAMGMATGGFMNFAAGAMSGGVKHAGGDVGGEGASRSVPSAVFASARRYHEGGKIGPDEMPIIAQQGETVLTKDQANDIKARLGEKKSGPESKGVTVVNITDPREIETFLATNPGALLNVLSRNASAAKKILQIKG